MVVKVMCASHKGSETFLSQAFENVEASCFTSGSSRLLFLEPSLSEIRSGFASYVLLPK